MNQLVKNVANPNLHNAVKRNTMKLLQHIDLPESLQGAVINCVFKFIEKPKEAVDVKATSIAVLEKLSKL